MPKFKAVFFDIKDIEKEFLIKNKPELCEFILIKDNFHNSFDKYYEEIVNADVISVFTTSRVRKEQLEKLPNLRLLTTRSTGFSHIDTDYLAKREIPAVNVPRYGDCTVAEFAFGLLLNVSRKITQADEDLRRGIIRPEATMGMDLYTKTIGIIGTGAIGAHAIKIANGFCMNILAYDPHTKQELIDKYAVKYVELNELLDRSDIISLHAPSTKENFHMINDEAFNKMKKGVIIVNTARGEIIDTEALYRAIKNGIVAGAGLDVLECEEILAKEDQYLIKIDCIQQDCLRKTIINHKLLELPNVIITPHIAFDTIEAVKRILETTISNINTFIDGKIQNRVN